MRSCCCFRRGKRVGGRQRLRRTGHTLRCGRCGAPTHTRPDPRAGRWPATRAATTTLRRGRRSTWTRRRCPCDMWRRGCSNARPATLRAPVVGARRPSPRCCNRAALRWIRAGSRVCGRPRNEWLRHPKSTDTAFCFVCFVALYRLPSSQTASQHAGHHLQHRLQGRDRPLRRWGAMCCPRSAPLRPLAKPLADVRPLPALAARAQAPRAPAPLVSPLQAGLRAVPCGSRSRARPPMRHPADPAFPIAAPQPAWSCAAPSRATRSQLLPCPCRHCWPLTPPSRW